MMRSHLRSKALTVTALTTLVAAPLAVAAIPAPATADGPPASTIAVAWQRTALRTVFTETVSAPPVGALYLSFTSLAVKDAAKEGQQFGRATASAARERRNRADRGRRPEMTITPGSACLWRYFRRPTVTSASVTPPPRGWNVRVGGAHDA